MKLSIGSRFDVILPPPPPVYLAMYTSLILSMGRQFYIGDDIVQTSVETVRPPRMGK